MQSVVRMVCNPSPFSRLATTNYVVLELWPAVTCNPHLSSAVDTPRPREGKVLKSALLHQHPSQLVFNSAQQ